jgi:DNA helicase-2/ATP-dependent DNA helicase PcrA
VSRSIEDALRRKNISYQVYGGLSFYQRKEIKDILAYLRVIVNPNDEESIKRIINYPTRGIGQTTMDKLLIYANEKNISLFETLKNLSSDEIKINSGTKNKLNQFFLLIKSFQLLNESLNAFEIAEEVLKRIGIINVLKLDGTPESISRIENIEELINGIKDFIEGEKEVVDSKATLSDFLEDVALASELDKNINDYQKKVSLMTIHLAKGLEFNHVYIVGLEEDLFPSAMSSTTRADLEEERRLFYVALTRAKKKVTITYAKTRYRWGKLNDCEPSRFIKEIDKTYTNYNLASSITGSLNNLMENNSIRFRKPKNKIQLKKIKNNLSPSTFKSSYIDINKGDHIIHNRFGKGKVIETEGEGADKKAEVKFGSSGVKRILLKFAKYKLI